ncbi:MAG: ATP synthase subunit I [Nitrococcus sp.]|nr:ATP synthase subunit I [Nitrococcus sp.]
MTHVPYPQAPMRNVLVRLIVIQTVATLAIALGFYLWIRAPLAVWSVLYGGAIAMVVALLLAWRVHRASRPGASIAGLYLSTLERALFVTVAFALALAVLKLAPLALISGFVGAEAAYYFTAGLLRGQTRA